MHAEIKRLHERIAELEAELAEERRLCERSECDAAKLVVRIAELEAQIAATPSVWPECEAIVRLHGVIKELEAQLNTRKEWAEKQNAVTKHLKFNRKRR